MLLEDGTEHIGSGPFPPGKGTAAEPHPDFVFPIPSFVLRISRNVKKTELSHAELIYCLVYS